jgi:hypothetical protein
MENNRVLRKTIGICSIIVLLATGHPTCAFKAPINRKQSTINKKIVAIGFAALVVGGLYIYNQWLKPYLEERKIWEQEMIEQQREEEDAPRRKAIITALNLSEPNDQIKKLEETLTPLSGSRKHELYRAIVSQHKNTPLTELIKTHAKQPKIAQQAVNLFLGGLSHKKALDILSMKSAFNF